MKSEAIMDYTVPCVCRNGDGPADSVFYYEMGSARPGNMITKASFMGSRYVVHTTVFHIGIIQCTPARDHSTTRKDSEVGGILM